MAVWLFAFFMVFYPLFLFIILVFYREASLFDSVLDTLYLLTYNPSCR